MRDNEALRRELAKKQEQSSSEDDSDSDESREELIAKAKASLGECVNEEEPGSALLNMKFMVKAREAQRAPRFSACSSPRFTGSTGGVGKVVDCSRTRAAIGWEPRYKTFSHFIDEIVSEASK